MVSFKKGQLQVLAHGWDRDLGGRDFDEALFDYWCKEFDTKFKLDVRSSPRASFRLRLACEKVQPPSSPGLALGFILIRLLPPGSDSQVHLRCWDGVSRRADCRLSCPSPLLPVDRPGGCRRMHAGRVLAASSGLPCSECQWWCSG